MTTVARKLEGWARRNQVRAMMRRKWYARWLADQAPELTDEQVAEVNRILGPIPRGRRKPGE